MGDQNEKFVVVQKILDHKLKKEHTREILELVSLQDVPLEVRRREAKKPLFITRYE